MKRLGNTATSCNELQGAIEKTGSCIKTHSVEINLDRETAFALCNVLSIDTLAKLKGTISAGQHVRLVNLGRAVAAFVDHPSRSFEHLEETEA